MTNPLRARTSRAGQGTGIIKVRSPADDIEQVGAELKHDAQLGADMQEAGMAWHE